jgi:hypothetical protein
LVKISERVYTLRETENPPAHVGARDGAWGALCLRAPHDADFRAELDIIRIVRPLLRNFFHVSR